MNRRAFLSTLAALAAAPFVVSAAPAPATVVAKPELGIAIRFMQHFDASRPQMVNRFDCLYGFATVRPELACRVTA